MFLAVPGNGEGCLEKRLEAAGRNMAPGPLLTIPYCLTFEVVTVNHSEVMNLLALPLFPLNGLHPPLSLMSHDERG